MPSKTDIPAVLDRTPMERTITQTPCLCGCGGFPTRDTAAFIPGHDARYKSALVAAHLAGKMLLVRDADGEREVSPMELAEARFWGGYLTEAERKAEAKEAADKAKKEAAAKKNA